MLKAELEKYLKQKVVLDTSSSWVYIGVLEEVTDHCAVLSDVDVHDSKDTPTSKEIYTWQSAASGVKANRNRTYVNLQYLVSFSPLDDVKKF
ncbi:MAG: hypothetical protein NT166_01495 [Candidatus Aminicenantes bacterium]|nr:hypothetical protein [Candidatus Aminicenantes bacterium]